MTMLSTTFLTLLILATAYSHGVYYGDSASDDDEESDSTCLPPIERGLIVTPFKRSYEHGESIEISCQEGYVLNNKSPNSTCQAFSIFGKHGVFMPAINIATCQEKPRCSPPLGHGIVVTHFKMFYELGENITISCKEGYALDAAETHTCEKKRDYHGRLAGAGFRNLIARHACKEIQDCSTPIQNGLIVEPFKMTYKPGEEVMLSCEEDHDLVVANVSVCHESGVFEFQRRPRTDYDFNIWDGHHFIVTTAACRRKAKCSAPDYPGVLVTPMKSWYFTGEEIMLSCEEGYELTSPNKSTCGYGDDDFLQMLGQITKFGVFVPMVKPRTCTRKPKCFAVRRRGVNVTPEKVAYMEGETIEVSCDDGYELVGNSTRTCTRDKYFHRFGISQGFFSPDMDDACKKKVSCKYGRHRGVVLTPKKTAYDIGETVMVSCDDGYVLKMANETTCEENKSGYFRKSSYGKFSPDIDDGACERIPSCDMPDHEGLILTPKKSYYEIGEKVELSCEEGYEQRVAPMSTCIRDGYSRYGTFDPDLGHEACRKPTVCAPPSYDHLIVTPSQETYEEGDEIILSCEPGYTLIASEKMSCERARHCKNQGHVSGCFHPPIGRVACIETPMCKPPTAGGLVFTPEKDEYEEGEVLIMSCSEGYELTIHKEAVCRQSRSYVAFRSGFRAMGFRPSIPKDACRKKKFCDTPEVQPGMMITPEKDRYYVGDEIQLSCDEGYQLTGESTSTCVSKTKQHRFMGVLVVSTRRRRTAFSPPIGVCKAMATSEPEEVVPDETDGEGMEEEATGEIPGTPGYPDTTEQPVETEEPTPPEVPAGPIYPEEAMLERVMKDKDP